jgi:hypothetical protein
MNDRSQESTVGLLTSEKAEFPLSLSMKIKIRESVGEHCMTLQQGQNLYEIIYPELRSGNPVELDFLGVKIFAAPFFNAAIGQLLRDLTSESIDELLTVKNLSSLGTETLELTIETANRYYANPTYRQAVDETMQEMAAGA